MAEVQVKAHVISTKLRDRTLYLLQNRSVKLSLKKISEDTSLPETWLSMFHNNAIEDPGVNRIETLYEYLSNSTIQLS